MRVLGPQMVSLHTFDGVQLYQFTPSEVETLVWRRELNNTSKATATVPTKYLNTDVTPWLHWLSVWDEHGTVLYWTGPVQTATYNRETTTIDAADVSALMSRTRVPLTKQWESADAATIAAELWNGMIEAQGLRGVPTVRLDPTNVLFNYQCTADTQMLDKAFGDLQALGLTWTVAAGTPLLGPAPTSPIITLGDDDFVQGNLALIRDGTRTFTDVLVRSASDEVRARVNLGGLNLQTIVDINNLNDLNSASSAAENFLTYSASMREAVSLNGSANLHPHAPVTIDALVPSVRMTVSAYDILTVMELHTLEVTTNPNDLVILLAMESVLVDPPELVKKETQSG